MVKYVVSFDSPQEEALKCHLGFGMSRALKSKQNEAVSKLVY